MLARVQCKQAVIPMSSPSGVGPSRSRDSGTIKTRGVLHLAAACGGFDAPLMNFFNRIRIQVIFRVFLGRPPAPPIRLPGRAGAAAGPA